MAIHRPVVIQPFVEEIQSRGEWSLVFMEPLAAERLAETLLSFL